MKGRVAALSCSPGVTFPRWCAVPLSASRSFRRLCASVSTPARHEAGAVLQKGERTDCAALSSLSKRQTYIGTKTPVSQGSLSSRFSCISQAEISVSQSGTTGAARSAAWSSAVAAALKPERRGPAAAQGPPPTPWGWGGHDCPSSRPGPGLLCAFYKSHIAYALYIGNHPRWARISSPANFLSLLRFTASIFSLLL